MGKPITDARQVTAGVLTDILREDGMLNQGEVTQIKKKVGPKTRSSVTTHFFVTYSDNAPASAPKRLFLKVAQGSKEFHFYKDFVPDMHNPPVVRCYDAVYSGEVGLNAYHLLLEDVSETHTMPRPGPGVEWPRPIDQPHVEQIIDSFAQIHAHWWKELQLGGGTSNFPERWYQQEYNKIVARAQLRCSKTPEELAEFLKFMEERLSQAQRKSFERTIAKFPVLLVKRVGNGKHLTLIHQDADNLGNILIPDNPKKDRCYIIDWQSYCLWFGADDLTCHITPFWSPSVRHTIQHDLLRRYYNSLLMYGVKNYDWEDFWYDYRLGVIWQFYAWVHISGDWDQLSYWIFENVMSAFEDLGCLELL